MTKQHLAVVSGGLDSTILAYTLKASDSLGGIISFDYGQRHRRELTLAERTASKLRVDFILIDLNKSLGAVRGRSALLNSGVAVPEGHYADDNMRVTVVPNRNATMLSIAAMVAGIRGLDSVVCGVHAGDHTIYPDCRPEFIDTFNEMLRASFGEMGSMRVVAPFLRQSKASIVELGMELGVPFEDTWSCYVGGDEHCGRCGTCVERLEAMHLAGADAYDLAGGDAYDRTVYADRDYWRTVTGSGKRGEPTFSDAPPAEREPFSIAPSDVGDLRGLLGDLGGGE